jgi:hypothetical protein
LTIKTPHQNHQFFKTPSKTPEKQQKLPSTTTQTFSSKNTGLGLKNGLEEQTD